MGISNPIDATMPALAKVAVLPFLFRTNAHTKFHSTLERLRRESTVCPLIEEQEKHSELEASYSTPTYARHGESAQPSVLDWRIDYSNLHLEKGYVERKIEEPRWQRRCRCVGRVALLMLFIIALYIIIYMRALGP
jgi:hypothetical protein